MINLQKLLLQKTREINQVKPNNKNVVLWISRDQRLENNWALFLASSLAKQYQSQLSIVFCLQFKFLEAQKRQFDFMLAGLKSLDQSLKDYGFSLQILNGEPKTAFSKFYQNSPFGYLVSDFSPLKIKQTWKESLLPFCEKKGIKFLEVDTHNLIPPWILSSKQEYAARTIRPKVHRLKDQFLVQLPEAGKALEGVKPGDALESSFFSKINSSYIENQESSSTDYFKHLFSGPKTAKQKLQTFLQSKIQFYKDFRNDPNRKVISELSSFLHFGQISIQEILLQTQKTASPNQAESFVEEVLVRRELAENFCFYNSNYDNPNCMPAWAKQTLDEHLKDEREFLYNLKEFEEAKTHDELWNASQKQLVKTGKMHGFLRMYWAKKVLEWTKNYTEAWQILVYLNDKYELDGRDPNGYTGIAWSIGGVHDRPWFERPVFGKIRYMNYNGCKRKFDVKKFIDKWS